MDIKGILFFVAAIAITIFIIYRNRTPTNKK